MRGCGLLLIIMMSAISVDADEPTKPITSLPTNATMENFILGSGDTLAITIQGEDELSRNYRIDADGVINLLWAGPVVVSGLRLSEVTQKLTEFLSQRYIRHPNVSIQLADVKSRYAILYGADAPRKIPLPPDARLLDVLTTSGIPFSPEKSVVTILRQLDTTSNSSPPAPTSLSEAKGKSEQLPESNDSHPDRTTPMSVTTVNLHHVLTTGDRANNIVIQDRDILYLEGVGSSADRTALVTRNSVVVLGEVQKPGYFSCSPGDTVMSMILAAGGFTEYAAGNRTKLYHGSGKSQKVVKMKMYDVMIKGERQKDHDVAPGDTIVVPASIF